MKRKVTFAAGAALFLLFAAPAMAAEFEVKMLNKGSDKQAMVFEPAFLRVQPGDTVRFVSTDKGHDAESIDGMMPEGAVPFKGKISETVTVTFDKPGLYGVKCNPHFGMGMVGLVQVGEATNLDAVKQIKLPPFAGKRMAILFTQAAQATAQASQ